MSKHTPGPWRVLPRNPELVKLGDLSYTVGPVEFVGHNVCTTHRLANADLIAAAPVLLKIVETLCNDTARAMMSDDDWAQVRACVAKAKGEHHE